MNRASIFPQWCALLLGLGPVLFQPLAQVDQLVYRAVRSSAFEVQPTDAPTSIQGPFRVLGSFLMTPQVAPLDWENYRISDLRLEVLPDAAPPAVLRGSGTFRRSGLFNRMRMDLDVQLGETALHLTSGELPAEPWTPDIDMVLKGKAADGARPGTYVLRLAAVRELARWQYRLIDGSSWTDDCEKCGRPTIRWSLHGGFDLVLVEEHPLFNRYHLFDIRFFSGTDYELEGEGDYQVGGEVALRQELRLDVDAKGTFGGPRTMTLINMPGPPTRLWPMWAVDVQEAESTPKSKLLLELRAAPVRELWFSTTHGMTSGLQPGLQPRISGGDVLTDSGRRVKTNAQLISALGWTEPKEALAVDALTIAPGGEVWFSFSEGQTSPTLGVISDGDLVSDHGRIVRRNGELMASFGLMPPLPDLGLDGVQVLDDGEILFSIVRESFSERLGVMLRPGDILSSRGNVTRAAKELLAVFEPEDQAADPGLDAFFVWPSGEVWFSTESGFISKTMGAIMDGALLSDQGYVVAHNLDLVRPFQPLEDLANFGLDGLFLVTDVAAPAKAARVLLSLKNGEGGGVRLTWPAQGRVFQVEATTAVGDPFAPVSPIVPDLEWTDSSASGLTQSSYYRLRQW